MNWTDLVDEGSEESKDVCLQADRLVHLQESHHQGKVLVGKRIIRQILVQREKLVLTFVMRILSPSS